MATIKPLNGKYYGTIIETKDGDEIKVWCPNHFAKPFASSREIQEGWAPEDGHDHVEDQQSYKMALVIAEALTKAGY